MKYEIIWKFDEENNNLIVETEDEKINVLTALKNIGVTPKVKTIVEPQVVEAQKPVVKTAPVPTTAPKPAPVQVVTQAKEKTYTVVYVIFGRKSKEYAYGTYMKLEFGDVVSAPILNPDMTVSHKKAVVTGTEQMTLSQIKNLAKTCGVQKLSRIDKKWGE